MSATRDIHVGAPAIGYEFEDSVSVHFHDFENLPAEKDKSVSSPEFMCAGNEWSLVIYPGGDGEAMEGMVSVYLRNKSPTRIKASYSVSFIRSDKTIYIPDWELVEEECDFNPKQYNRMGTEDFISREEILDKSNKFLKGGTLTFFIRIKPVKDHYCLPAKPQPELNLGENISKLYGENQTADLAFKVGNSKFFAHKLILQAQAPELSELAEQFNVNAPMAINDVDPDIFEMMLRYVYGKRIHTGQWRDHSKKILTASGKYGLTELKKEAEAWHINNLNLTAESAVDELLYADGTHCLEMKKAVIQFIVENGEEVLSSSSYAKLYESPELIKEVMVELSKAAKRKKQKLS